MSLSIIITAYKEPNTLQKQLDQIISNLPRDSEILVCAPDQATQDIALKYQKPNQIVKLIQDLGTGKPAALNLAFKKATGDIWILTDGDVKIGDNALQSLIQPFQDSKIGAVSGHPISINERNNLFGYWSQLLTNLADQLRQNKIKKGEQIDCSGYLYAIRGNLIKNIPKNLLSDDAWISYLIRQAGYKISYVPESKVFVKYPTSFKDWIKQKRRSGGGYLQIQTYLKNDPKQSKQMMRSFRKESLGIFQALKFSQNVQEFWWTIILIFARIYLWLLIFWSIKIKKMPFNQIWQRVESTKN